MTSDMYSSVFVLRLYFRYNHACIKSKALQAIRIMDSLLHVDPSQFPTHAHEKSVRPVRLQVPPLAQGAASQGSSTACVCTARIHKKESALNTVSMLVSNSYIPIQFKDQKSIHLRRSGSFFNIAKHM